MTDPERIRELEADVAQLSVQVTEQRAELTDGLSELFKSIPACYDTPVDHYREMARRLVEDRDIQKHRARELEAEVLRLTRELDGYRDSYFKALSEAGRLSRAQEELRKAALKLPRPWIDGGVSYLEWEAACDTILTLTQPDGSAT